MSISIEDAPSPDIKDSMRLGGHLLPLSCRWGAVAAINKPSGGVGVQDGRYRSHRVDGLFRQES